MINEYIAVVRNQHLKGVGFRRSKDIHKSKKKYDRKQNKEIEKDGE